VVATGANSIYSGSIQRIGVTSGAMKRAAAILSIIAIGAALPGIADAQGRGRGGDRDRDRGERSEQDRARGGVRQGSMVPLERVIPHLNRRTPGQMVDTRVQERGGQTVYRVRWRSADGRGIDYLVDAATGRIVGVVGE